MATRRSPMAALLAGLALLCIPVPATASDALVPSLELSPAVGPPATTVTVTGAGFEACLPSHEGSGVVQLLWDGQPATLSQVRDDGTFSASFPVPERAEPGRHEVAGACYKTLGPKGVLATATFVIPRMGLAPGSIAPSGTVTATGNGFPPACVDTLELRLDGLRLELRGLLFSEPSAKDGTINFTAGFEVPVPTEAGKRSVSGHCPAGETDPVLASAILEVLPPDTPPLGTTTTTGILPGNGGPGSTDDSTSSGSTIGGATTSSAPAPPTGRTTTPGAATSTTGGGAGSLPGSLPPTIGGRAAVPTTSAAGRQGPADPPAQRLTRSPFPASVRAPSEVDTTLRRLLRSVALTLVLVLLVGFPAEIFNKTLEENYDEIRGWFPRRRAWRAPRFRGGTHLAVFIVLGSLLLCLVDPTAGIDRKTGALALGFLVALPLTTLFFEFPIEVYYTRVTGLQSRIRVLPLALVVAGACALLSREAHFLPGYVYGLFAGYGAVRGRVLVGAEEGRGVLLGALSTLGVSLLAWMVWGAALARAAARPGAGFGVLVLDAALSAMFVLGVEGVLFALIPLRFLQGQKLASWNRALWAVTFGSAAFCFVHVLLDTNHAQAGTVSLTSVLALFAAFGALSLTFWAYFRYRPKRVPRAEGR